MAATSVKLTLTDSKIAALKPPASGREEYTDHKITGLRLRVGSSGKKVWIFRKRVDDKVINRTLGAYPGLKLAGARDEAEKVLEALARGGGTAAIDRTFRDAAEHWMEKVAKGKNDSWKLQERQLERHVLPVLGKRKIREIRRADVRDLIEGIEGAILPNRVLALVKVIFRYAVSRDWIDTSPAEGVLKPKAESERERVLDMAEVKRVWDAAEHLGYPFGPWVRLMLLTGQRRTEVASMRWDAIDLQNATWSLKADDTKADRGHLVPLSAPVVAILKQLPQIGDYVLSSDGKTHIKAYGQGKAKLDTFIAAGGPMAGWTYHDLRRTAATHMVRLGVSMEVVGRVLNHAVQGITAKVYALHSFAPEKRAALDKWASEIDAEVKGRGKVVKLRA